MKDVNKIILLGRLGADPVRRATKTGNHLVQFSLATSRRFHQENDVEGKPTGEETQWHRVVVWGKQGENCAQYLRKGQPVYVEGNFRSRKYSQEGTERISFEVHAENVVFLGGAGRRREGAEGGSGELSGGSPGEIPVNAEHEIPQPMAAEA